MRTDTLLCNPDPRRKRGPEPACWRRYHVGDFRTQKGKGNFGSFEMVHDDETEARWQRIVAEGGRAVQEQGMAEPECYDAEAAKLLAWFDTEAERRDFKVTK